MKVCGLIFCPFRSDLRMIRLKKFVRFFCAESNISYQQPSYKEIEKPVFQLGVQIRLRLPFRKLYVACVASGEGLLIVRAIASSSRRP